MEETKSTALVLRNMSDLNNALVSNKDKTHILTPFTQLMFEEDLFAPGFRPSLRTITLDTSEDAGEVYESWEKKGEFALTKKALDKLAQVAGIEWVHVYRVDKGTDPLMASFYAEGKMRLIDGTFHHMPASKSINLNDGSPEANAMKAKPNQLAGARKNIVALAESKAKNRVIRALLGLKQSYKPAELKKPFLVMKIVPDMNDPEVKRMVQAQMLGMEKFLFAPQANPEQEALPAGTDGLELPPVPGTANQTGSGPVIDIQAENVKTEPSGPTPEEIRKKKIERIEGLYYTKTHDGVRDPKKAPLSELSNDALDQIESILSEKPDVRAPKPKEEDLV